MALDNKELASLRILAGPSTEKVFSIVTDSVTMGRSDEADIVIDDTLLSREHIRLFRKKGKWYLEDLGSSNGTWLGGREVKNQMEVGNYQRIRAGNSLCEIIFTSDEEEYDPAMSYSFAPESLKGDTSTLPIEDIRFGHRRLAVMYSLQNDLAQVYKELDVYRCICTALMSEISADYIHMILFDFKKEEFVHCYGQNAKQESISLSNHPASNSVLEYVKKKCEAVLSVDPPNDIRFASDSLTLNKTEKVICVPMISQNGLLGVIYMAVVTQDKIFSEEDLQLLAGVGHSSSMAIMNCRLLKKNMVNERLAVLGSTAASLSHYIKNILTGVDGCLYLLRMGIDDEDPALMNEAWGILSRNHKRLSSLVLDLLNLTKENTLSLSVQSVGEAIIEVVELVRPNFCGMNIEITVDDNLLKQGLMAEFDAKAIHRVLLNLLNNSCDAVYERYQEKEGGKVELSASVTNHERIVEIVVKDNGCGIPQDKIEEVFEMFYSGKGECGTGLGLAVSKRLIEAHHGVISVESEVGEFTTFFIRLPLTQHIQGTQLLQRPF
ncbi:MAG: FHA domain-containing protein [Lentisphaeraceae bacterium]|nr:FHA domain-containing protein [Lentisphaeraceae bacterium]